MTYEESLKYIHSLDKFGSRPGLDRVKMLFDTVPEVLDQQFIHVAGTNGKGSVCAMLSAVLKEAGYRVGLFTSPFIVDFRERIQINNEMIAQSDLAAAVEYFVPKLKALNEQGVIITEFEFITVLAFWVFQQQRCDIVVCETGMGGLLDSTNLIPCPLCSVITRIDLDHTAVLGDTIEKIAYQKAGIIKEGSVTVSAPQVKEAFAVIEAQAREKRNPLCRAEDVKLTVTGMDRDGTRFVYRDTQMRLPLVGAHQIDNLRCALSAIEALAQFRSTELSVEAIRDGLMKVRHPARFEKLCDSPVVILDGAHNPNGLAAFADAVRAYYPDGDKTLVIGMLADKDSTSLHLLKGLFRHAVVTDIDNPRALPAEALADRLQEIVPQITVKHVPKEALEKALSYGDNVFICGSLYLAGEIRPYLISS